MHQLLMKLNTNSKPCHLVVRGGTVFVIVQTKVVNILALKLATSFTITSLPYL